MRACDYHEHDRPCRQPAVVEIKLDGKPVKLCDRHLRPEYHPEDIRKKLPRKLATALRRFR
jgi:hypothetical protein